jgi:hypothetical protein
MISSSILTEDILFLDRQENSIIVYLTENFEDNTLKSYIQAINSANSTFWKKAIEKEVLNRYEQDVWVIVKKQEDQHCINCTWVFIVKKNQLNVAIEYKERLQGKGFQQIKGGLSLQFFHSKWRKERSHPPFGMKKRAELDMPSLN